MGGWIKYLGFTIPLTVAFGLDKDPPCDSYPRPGRCSFCRRARPRMYRLGDERWMCSVCLDDTVRVRSKRVTPQRRPVDPSRPVELTYEAMESKPDRFESRAALWDRWLD